MWYFFSQQTVNKKMSFFIVFTGRDLVQSSYFYVDAIFFIVTDNNYHIDRV